MVGSQVGMFGLYVAVCFLDEDVVGGLCVWVVGVADPVIGEPVGVIFEVVDAFVLCADQDEEADDQAKAKSHSSRKGTDCEIETGNFRFQVSGSVGKPVGSDFDHFPEDRSE